MALRSGAALAPLIKSPVLSAFGRVLLHDSTCIGLPAHPAKLYPGCRNQHRQGTSYAVLRLQVVYNLLTDQCLHFTTSPYTRNDQAASPDILAWVRSRDLILRDLGCFVLDVFERLHQRGAYFLSRLRHDVQVWTSTGARINWRTLSRTGVPLDEMVWLGQNRRLRVRLIARHPPL